MQEIVPEAVDRAHLKERTRRWSEREPADSLRDKSNVIGGWLPSLTFALGMKSHMNRKIIAIVLAISVLVVTSSYIVYVPLRGDYLGPVAVSVQHYTTNALGQVNAMVAITNGGFHTIRFAVGTQMFQDSGWVDSVSGTSHFSMSMDPDPLISPHAERVVAVGIPATTSLWRVHAMCQKEYPEHWSKRLRWIGDTYLLKRGVVKYVHSPEIQR